MRSSSVRRSLLLLLLAAAPLAAQEKAPWRASYFPYFMGDPTNGFMVIGHYQLARQANYDARVPFEAVLAVEAGIGTRGSRFAIVKYRAPLLVDGWRFAGDVGAVRQGTFGYFGQGPDGEGALVGSGADRRSDFFRVHRARFYGRAEVTRQIKGPLQLAAAAGIAHYRYTKTSASDAFLADFFEDPLSGTDATGRLSLIFDTRDNEFTPGNGLFLEAGLYAGTGRFEERNVAPGGGGPVASFSPRGYTGAYVHLRGFVSPRGGTVIAGRLAVRALGKNAPLDARYQMPGWERDVEVYGGVDSHRSFIRGRFVGRGVLFGSLEVRHNLLDMGDYGAVTVLAFLDGGRVFEDAPQITLDGWRIGGGGGLALRVLRSAVLTFNFAGGGDGFTFSMGSGWSF